MQLDAGTYIASDKHPVPEKCLATRDQILSTKILHMDREFLDAFVHVHVYVVIIIQMEDYDNDDTRQRAQQIAVLPM